MIVTSSLADDCSAPQKGDSVLLLHIVRFLFNRYIQKFNEESAWRMDLDMRI